MRNGDQFVRITVYDSGKEPLDYQDASALSGPVVVPVCPPDVRPLHAGRLVSGRRRQISCRPPAVHLRNRTSDAKTDFPLPNAERGTVASQAPALLAGPDRVDVRIL